MHNIHTIIQSIQSQWPKVVVAMANADQESAVVLKVNVKVPQLITQVLLQVLHLNQLQVLHLNQLQVLNLIEILTNLNIFMLKNSKKTVEDLNQAH